MTAHALTSADVETAFATLLPTEIRLAIDAAQRLCDRFRQPLCWPADVLIEENQLMRTTADFADLYMPFDHLLFFSAAGDGDLFALAVDADGKIRRNDIFVWRHELDSREWFAGNFAAYVAARQQS